MSPVECYDPELEFRTTRWTECPHCRNYVKFLFSLAEKSVECPHCWEQFVMPALPPLVPRRFRRTDENRGVRIVWLCFSALFAAVSVGCFFEGWTVGAAIEGLTALGCLLIVPWLPPKRTCRQRLILASQAYQLPVWMSVSVVFAAMMPPAALTVLATRLVFEPLQRGVASCSGLLIGAVLGGFMNSWLLRRHFARTIRQYVRDQSRRGMSPAGMMKHCMACGYEPVAGPVDWCPECGTSFRPFGDLAQTLRELKLDPRHILHS